MRERGASRAGASGTRLAASFDMTTAASSSPLTDRAPETLFGQPCRMGVSL